MESIRKTWDRIALFLILLASGFLGFYSVGKEGYGNTYYAAAVKSMLMSWHNFFYLSFDPGGYVTIDKPPIAFWLQAASARIFGFQGWSLILPEALATVVSVALLYHLVQRVFGKTAGLMAAAALAVTPILVAVSRTNEPDPTLVMVVLFAAWALIIAAERSSLKHLLLAMFLVGIGFNVKMAEAFLVLPAFYVVYWLYSSVTIGRKVAHLALATVLLIVISLSWATIVDMTPATMRPYVGSSQTNSELELAIGYNGIQRVLPSGGPFGKHPTGNVGADKVSGLTENQMRNLEQEFAAFASGSHAPTGTRTGINGRPGGGGSGMGGGGGSAVFRLFDFQMAGQISWLFPLAFLGIIGAYLRTRRRGIDPADSKNTRLALAFWGMWSLPMAIYFSISGFFHLYYMSMLAPGIAALAAIGLRELYLLYKEEQGVRAYLLPVALIATGGLQVFILSSYPGWSAWLTPVAGGLSLLCALVLVVMKVKGRSGLFQGARLIAATGLIALLVAPFVWSVTPMIYGTNASSPTAGPELANSGGTGFGGGFPGGNTATPQLINFLLQHNGNTKYLVAVPNAMTAAPIILQTGKAVMAVGGFMGRDPILTVPRLQQMVADGELRYFMVQGSAAGGGLFGMFGGDGGQSSAVTNWVKAHGTLVPQQEWSTPSLLGSSTHSGRTSFGAMQLYDLNPVQATLS